MKIVSGSQLANRKLWLNRVLWLILALLLVLGAFSYPRVLAYWAERADVTVSLPEGHTRQTLTAHLGDVLNWSESERQDFISAIAEQQWGAVNAAAEFALANRYNWQAAERQAFKQRIEDIKESSKDPLHTVYKPGIYHLSDQATVAAVASQLVAGAQISSKPTESVNGYSRLDWQRAELLASDIQQAVELRPDIVPLPPHDLAVRNSGDRTLLTFSTTYYNAGRGPLKLLAGEEVHEHTDSHFDSGHQVRQVINRVDGSERRAQVGVFGWHETHQHYHFSDFVDYLLEPESVDTASDTPSVTGSSSSGQFRKVSFCVRDVSRVEFDSRYAKEEAEFRVCDKHRQGVSVGWGDTYFADYPDQNLDITGLPAGRYRLTFEANPKQRFVEENLANNTVSAVIELDPSAGVVELLATNPPEYPAVEHVYPAQDFGGTD